MLVYVEAQTCFASSCVIPFQMLCSKTAWHACSVPPGSMSCWLHSHPCWHLLLGEAVSTQGPKAPLGRLSESVSRLTAQPGPSLRRSGIPCPGAGAGAGSGALPPLLCQPRGLGEGSSLNTCEAAGPVSACGPRLRLLSK